MTNPSQTLRSCPTRPDGVEVLIAHSISVEICGERQRRLYHKCFTCVHCGVSAKAPATTLPEEKAPPAVEPVDAAEVARPTATA